MVCGTCNAELGPEVRFCPKCGAPVVRETAAPGFVPPYPPVYAQQYRSRPRVARNIQALAIVWFVFGTYRVLSGLVGIFFLHVFTARSFGAYGWPFGGHMPPQLPPTWMSVLIPMVATLTVISAALAFATGWSLMTRRPWGRTLAIIAGVLALLKFPLGTALGIYTLWVLAPAESGAEYDSISAGSGRI